MIAAGLSCIVNNVYIPVVLEGGWCSGPNEKESAAQEHYLCSYHPSGKATSTHAFQIKTGLQQS